VFNVLGLALPLTTYVTPAHRVRFLGGTPHPGGNKDEIPVRSLYVIGVTPHIHQPPLTVLLFLKNGDLAGSRFPRPPEGSADRNAGDRLVQALTVRHESPHLSPRLRVPADQQQQRFDIALSPSL